MKIPADISEFMIIGFLSSITFAMIFFIAENITPQIIIDYLKNLSSAEVIGYSILCYVTGLLTHRILMTINYEFFKRVIGLRIFKLLFSKKDRSLITSFDRGNWNETYATILQFGSEAVINKINYQDSTMRIFKAFGIILPFTSIVLSVWISKYYNAISGVVVCIGLIILAVLSFKSHRILKHSQITFVTEVKEVIVERKKTKA